MLSVADLHAYYGKSHVLNGVNLFVGRGEIVSLLGRNGVGRSTTIKAIMGLVTTRGSIMFQGHDIAGMKTHEIALRGIGYVPEDREIFPDLTVRENLLLGMKSRQASPRWRMDDMYELFPRLKAREDTAAGVLSGGEQQMLTLCRTLIGDPDLIMIDEPTEGLAPLIVAQVAELLREIRRRGVSILLVEQNARAALQVADHAYVMELGEITLEGPAAELAANPRVTESYLGLGNSSEGAG